jgi:modulator of FtsH protease
MYDPNNPLPTTTGYGTVDLPGRRDSSLLDRVLGWLALSLVLTAAGVYGSIAMGLNLPFIAIILMFGLIFGIQWAVRSGNTALGASLFAVFSVAEGMFLGPVIYDYLQVDPGAVGNAVLGTAGIFVAAASVVWVTNRSFAAWGKWLFAALIVGIVLMIASVFIHSINQLFIDVFLGVVFVGLTMFDFWRVKASRPGDSALLIALSLYLDFINLFLILLRIFGRRR